MNKVIIQAAYWKGAILYLKLNTTMEASFFLSDGNHHYPMKCDGDLLYINVSNVPVDKMVPAGTWSLQVETAAGVQSLFLDAALAQSLEQLDKIFTYGLGYYAYTVQFQIEEQKLGLCMRIHTAFYMKNKDPYHRHYACESHHFVQHLGKWLNHLSEITIAGVYHVCALLRRQKKNRVLLMSETRTPISGNLKAIDDRIKEQYEQAIETVYYFDQSLHRKKASLFLCWLRLCWKMAGCSCILVDDYAPILKFVTIHKNTKVVQLWHAGVGFKSVGYARFGKEGSPYPYASGHRCYDYAVVGSQKLVPIYAEVFGIPEDRFLPYGLPRLSNYLAADKMRAYRTSFYERYPLCKGKKLILFAPTYRGATQDKAYYPYDKIELEAIQRLYQAGYVFGLKMHPFIKEKFHIPASMQHCMLDVSDEKDINTLFYVTDILITDYSSNIYEFSLFRKPVFFYAFDYEEYKLTRGLQSDLYAIPFGVIAHRFKDIEQAILQQQFHLEHIEEYIQDYHAATEACAADMVIQKLLL